MLHVLLLHMLLSPVAVARALLLFPVVVAVSCCCCMYPVAVSCCCFLHSQVHESQSHGCGESAKVVDHLDYNYYTRNQRIWQCLQIKVSSSPHPPPPSSLSPSSIKCFVQQNIHTQRLQREQLLVLFNLSEPAQ